LRIQSVSAYTYNAKYRYGEYSMSHGRVTVGHPALVVRVRTDTGLEGWGETSPHGGTYLPSFFAGELEAARLLARPLIGLDPRSVTTVNATMDQTLLAGQAAKSAIDWACWDVFGRSVDLPIHALLGGALAWSPPAFSVVSIGTPEEAARDALAEHRKGIARLQVKVGNDPRVDARRLVAAREALPEEVEVWVDANGGWNLGDVLTFCRCLPGDLVVALEQPCRTMTDCAEVGRRSGFPIVLDESVSTLADLAEAKVLVGASGMNLKSSRVGGLTKARVVRDAAIGMDLVVTIDDTWGGAITTAQNIQLAATTERLRGVTLFTEWNEPLVAEGPRMDANGTVAVPTAPGNGFAVNLSWFDDPIFEITA
jgi:L-alanine-DL-glutamate epimerase-like enolase superfamily enzyme